MRLASEVVDGTEVYWIDFSTEIAKGMALLDEKAPGWLDAMDLDRLDMPSSCCCILGQAVAQRVLDGARTYGAAIERLFGKTDVARKRGAVRYGFELPYVFFPWADVSEAERRRHAEIVALHEEVHPGTDTYDVRQWAWECLGTQWANAIRERRG